jgi:hypothetical protein
VSPALPLFLFLLQAEPAPPPAPPPPPVPLAPMPAPPAARPPEEPESPPPGWSLGLTLGGAWRLPPAARDVPPALGLAFSTFVGRRYATLGRLESGAMVSFAYQRHQSTVHLIKPLSPSEDVPYDGERTLSTGEFTLWQTLTLALGRVRPWLAAGPGMVLGHFTTLEPRYAPGESRPTLFQLAGAVGFHVEVAPQTDAGLQLDYAHAFGGTFVTDKGERLSVFGDRLALRLEMQYRF